MAEENNDAQAKALAETLAPLVAAALKPQLDERDKAVSDRLDGIASKNDELLGKLHKEKDERASFEDQLSALTDTLKGIKDHDGKPVTFQTGKDIVLSKEDARDVRKYQAAKVKAQEAGVELRIEGRNA